ncbi:MAG: type II toxin-antitoxin system PemK/MazF family toxin [Desulfovibrionaceae bacterium]
MGSFAVGTVVTVPYTYSDGSKTELRPAVIVADLPGVDSTVCAITSQSRGMAQRILINNSDLVSGSLRIEPSYAVPSKLFTVENSLVKKTVGQLSEAKKCEIVSAVIQLFQ